jgi:type IV fimbrial biogenesis protein FimT
MKLCRGFTLLELMVAIVVLAILATVGVPSFRDLVQSNRATTQANELVTALNVARTEAVKRGRNVQVVVANESAGWSATVAIAASEGETLRVVNRAGSAITVNGATVIFGPTGVPNAGETFDMQPAEGCAGDKRRQIVLGQSGRVSTTRQPCL